MATLNLKQGLHLPTFEKTEQVTKTRDNTTTFSLNTYIDGAYDHTNDMFHFIPYINEWWMFDVKRGLSAEVSTTGTKPSPTTSLTACWHGDQGLMYIGNTSDLTTYDPNTFTLDNSTPTRFTSWSPDVMLALTTDLNASAASSGANGGYIWAFRNNGTQVARYDPTANTWDDSSWNTPTYSSYSYAHAWLYSVSHDVIYRLSRGSSSSEMNIESYTISTNTWATVATGVRYRFKDTIDGNLGFCTDGTYIYLIPSTSNATADSSHIVYRLDPTTIGNNDILEPYTRIFPTYVGSNNSISNQYTENKCFITTYESIKFLNFISGNVNGTSSVVAVDRVPLY